MTGYVMVFAPAPQLTVTIEQRGDSPDIHLHAGGQGVWQARMVRSLGVDVRLCGVFGGETGQVVRPLIVDEGIEVRAVRGQSRNGSYVHDRRGGSRVDVVDAPGDPLTRHELDEVYGMALTEGLDAAVSLLSGPTDPGMISPSVYRRLAKDLRSNGCRVMADLSGEHLTEAVAGGLTFLKVSHEELLADGRARSDNLDDMIDAMCALCSEGAETVVVTRADRPALALMDGDVYEVVMPRLETADPRGAGDSMTAGVAASLAAGRGMTDAIRIGAAAGALNVTRHGLGTGDPEAIAQLCKRVHLEPVRATATAGAGREGPHLHSTPEQLAERIRRQ